MLKGKDIILESMTKNDLESIHQIILDDDMGKTFTTTHYECNLSTMGSMLFETEKGTQAKVFIAKLKDEIIGFITLNDMHPIRRSGLVGALGLKKKYQKPTPGAFRNTSYAYDITGMLVVYAFEILNLHKILAHTFSDNANVNKMYEMAGFTKEGIGRDYIYRNGEWLDRDEWGFLKKDYYQSKDWKEFKQHINWK